MKVNLEFYRAMEQETIQDLAIQFATEGLDSEQQRVYDAWLQSATNEEKQLFASTVDACAELSIASVSENALDPLASERVEDKLFRAIEAESSHTDHHHAPSDEDEDMLLIRKEDRDWINLPIKGAKVLELSTRKEDGFAMSIIEVAAGSVFPEHDHHGVEMAYILEGDLEADGVIFQAGDFFRADAGTHHGEHTSPSGCQALIVTANENYKHKTMKTLGAMQKVVRKVKKVFQH